MNKVSEVIKRLILHNKIPSSNKFEITEPLLRDYVIYYSELFTTSFGTTTKSNTKFARRLAGLNLLKENISRNVKATDILAGQVYLISNPAFKQHYKIGATYDTVKRLAQYQTYSPYRDFKIEKYDFVIDKFKAEKFLLNHPLLNKENGEWVYKENAKSIFDDLCDKQMGSW